MPTDINFLLRKWAFDMESEAFGTLRIGKIDMEKFFKEHEEAIRSGDLEGAQLARMLLENTARKLTGDGGVDKQCEGPLLESSEVALLQDDELDRFSDALVKGRLWFVVPAGSPMPPQSQGGGCAALAKELIRFANGAKANRAKMLESIKKDLFPGMTSKMPLSATEQVTALWKQTAAATAGLTAISGFEAARARQEAQLGLDLGPGSTIGKAVKEWERQEQLREVAMGYVGDSALAASIAQFQKDEKLTSTALGKRPPRTVLFQLISCCNIAASRWEAAKRI